MPKVSRLEVIQTGARRRWTLEEKQRIVVESARAPRHVSATARRHGLSVGQLFVWRRLAREGRLGAACDVPAFVPAIVAPGRETAKIQPSTDAMTAGRIEIVLSEPRRMIVAGDVDPAAVASLLAVLERR